MLQENSTQRQSAKGLKFAIIASRYNARFVDSMANSAATWLKESGAAKVDVIRVPGAFEIPVVVGRLASRKRARYDALICLGLILRGETTHADHIGEAVTQTLAQAQLQHGIPVIHEVLVVATQAQAVARCLNPKSNRGVEAAQTAVDMAQLMKSLS